MLPINCIHHISVYYVAYIFHIHISDWIVFHILAICVLTRQFPSCQTDILVKLGCFQSRSIWHMFAITFPESSKDPIVTLFTKWHQQQEGILPIGVFMVSWTPKILGERNVSKCGGRHRKVPYLWDLFGWFWVSSWSRLPATCFPGPCIVY